MLRRNSMCMAAILCSLLVFVIMPGQARAVTLGESTATDSTILGHTHSVDGANIIEQGVSVVGLATIEANAGLSTGTLFEEFDWVSYVRKTSSEFLNPESKFLTGLSGGVTLSRGASGTYSHSFDPLLNQPPDQITQAYLLIDLSAVRENDEGEIEVGDSFYVPVDLSNTASLFGNVFIDLAGLGTLTLDGSVDKLDITLTNNRDSGIGLFDKLRWHGSVLAYNVERGDDGNTNPGGTGAVPEPATAALGLIGLASLGVATRRRKTV